MDIIDSLADYTATVSLLDENDETLTCEAVLYTVLDGDETELIPETDITSQYTFGDTEISVVVDGVNNENALSQYTHISRRIKVKIVLLGGKIIYQDVYYLIKPIGDISLMFGSYQTYQESEATAMNIENVSLYGWDNPTTTKVQKISALKSAFQTIGKITFDVSPDGVNLVIENINEKEKTWVLENLPSRFIMALKRAQVIEANDLLTKILGLSEQSTLSEQEREDGVVSKTVGESSTTWKQSKKLKTPLSSSTMSELSRYINISSVKIARC